VTAPLERIRTLWELFLAGGLLMWPILGMSIVVVMFAIERLAALRRSRIVPRRLLAGIEKLVDAAAFDPRAAFGLCRQHPSVAADILETLLAKTGRPVPELERAVEVAKDREASRLYANVRPISLAVTVTPLLGLLGTVQGMIIAFYTTANLPAGANRAAELANGIYVALITTFAGLCVAIPAAILAHFIEGRIMRGFREVDDLVDLVLPQLERYENQGRPGPGRLSAAVGPVPPAVPPAAVPAGAKP
jgi:biopolymer transport protein ExbB